MDIREVCHAMLQPASLPNLSRISLKCEATRAIPTFQEFSNLRIVSFLGSSHRQELKPFKDKPLPWTGLTYFQRNYEVSIQLLGLLRTTLSYLWLNVDVACLRDFTEALAYLSVLETLHLFIELKGLSPSLLQSILDSPVRGQSNVRKVDVVSICNPWTVMSGHPFHGDPKTFWDWLLLRISNTEELRLPFVLESTMVSLRNLRKLRRFYCGYTILYHLREIGFCSSLQELTLECGAVTFLMLSSETVHKLAITFTEAHAIDFLALKWPSLTTLKLRLTFEYTSEPTTFDLPQLREIEVDGWPQSATVGHYSDPLAGLGPVQGTVLGTFTILSLVP